MPLRTPAEIKAMIVGKFPDAQVALKDLTGTGDHWQVTVVTKAFEGKSMLEQHRIVKSVFEADINSGAVHAFSLKTYTPEEWQKKS
ncbi:MAG TPA: BolA/IbaG family iron-sulfur metabolism protein [bacterium]|nr:BolA/IbaG family iron-sulfur metabolism protein [bacterium]